MPVLHRRRQVRNLFRCLASFQVTCRSTLAQPAHSAICAVALWLSQQPQYCDVMDALLQLLSLKKTKLSTEGGHPNTNSFHGL